MTCYQSGFKMGPTPVNLAVPRPCADENGPVTGPGGVVLEQCSGVSGQLGPPTPVQNPLTAQMPPYGWAGAAFATTNYAGAGNCGGVELNNGPGVSSYFNAYENGMDNPDAYEEDIVGSMAVFYPKPCSNNSEQNLNGNPLSEFKYVQIRIRSNTSMDNENLHVQDADDNDIPFHRVTIFISKNGETNNIPLEDIMAISTPLTEIPYNQVKCFRLLADSNIWGVDAPSGDNDSDIPTVNQVYSSGTTSDGSGWNTGVSINDILSIYPDATLFAGTIKILGFPKGIYSEPVCYAIGSNAIGASINMTVGTFYVVGTEWINRFNVTDDVDDDDDD